jgi:hypothetical protein
MERIAVAAIVGGYSPFNVTRRVIVRKSQGFWAFQGGVPVRLRNQGCRFDSCRARLTSYAAPTTFIALVSVTRGRRVNSPFRNART